MSDDRLTRRQWLRAGGALAGASLVAGCASDGTTGDGTGDATPTDASTDTPAETPTATATGTPTPATPYSVEMAPMGEVTFESVPESWMAYFSTYGDMAVALGRLDGLEALIFTDNWPLELYDALPDVDISFDDVPQLYAEESIDREAFYEFDADVHLFDPNFIQLLDDSWTDGDFREVADNVGPIVGNSIRRRGEDWHDYEYYSLYDAFEKVATVFRERERYEAIRGVHDGMLAEIDSRLPPTGERPTVGLLSVNSDFENGSFYAYPVHDGNGHKQYRDLGMRGAFDDHIEGSYAEWDYEQLVEVDPDALVFQYGLSHVSREEFEARLDAMRKDPLGSQLSAVQDGRLYRGGTSYQGPVVNLLQTEAAARQFYPDEFGEWEGVETLAETDDPLFGRRTVADAINGEI
ncbi:ABC transporter substrate-binding protein [Halosimplex halobium]|uniref:ABC transporter substrate-binding protein n=1 Tax=Halosimplex halobium TaxID=3396618 RepID=UPI003F55C5CE